MKKKPRNGVPRAVERSRGGKPVVSLEMDAARVVWALDLLAWIRHGQLAAKLDMRGYRAPLPAIVLPGSDQVVALEDVTAVRKLRSRHRAFSQIAGRYSPLVIGARDAGARIRLELWDLDTIDHGDAEALQKTSAQLADYMQADVRLFGRSDAARAFATVDDRLSSGELVFPDKLTARNPMAWQWLLGRDA